MFTRLFSTTTRASGPLKSSTGAKRTPKKQFKKYSFSERLFWMLDTNKFPEAIDLVLQDKDTDILYGPRMGLLLRKANETPENQTHFIKHIKPLHSRILDSPEAHKLAFHGYHSLITLCKAADFTEGAMNALQTMRKLHIVPDMKSYLCVLHMLLDPVPLPPGNLEQALQVYAESKTSGFLPKFEVFELLMSTLYREKSYTKVLEVFGDISRFGMVPKLKMLELALDSMRNSNADNNNWTPTLNTFMRFAPKLDHISHSICSGILNDIKQLPEGVSKQRTVLQFYTALVTFRSRIDSESFKNLMSETTILSKRPLELLTGNSGPTNEQILAAHFYGRESYAPKALKLVFEQCSEPLSEFQKTLQSLAEKTVPIVFENDWNSTQTAQIVRAYLDQPTKDKRQMLIEALKKSSGNICMDGETLQNVLRVCIEFSNTKVFFSLLRSNRSTHSTELFNRFLAECIRGNAFETGVSVLSELSIHGLDENAETFLLQMLLNKIKDVKADMGLIMAKAEEKGISAEELKNAVFVRFDVSRSKSEKWSEALDWINTPFPQSLEDSDMLKFAQNTVSQ